MKGRVNRERYVENFNLISPTYEPGQIFLHTSSYSRCYNSALSELLGLYPPEESSVTVLPRTLIDDLGLASPPFKIRNVEEISEKLGISALPFGFKAIPMTNHDFLNNELEWKSCPTMMEERAKIAE